MNTNHSKKLNMQLVELREYLDLHSDDDIKNAIAKDDFAGLLHLPASAREALADSPDLCTDIWWYTEIRSERDLDDFPCVHIAYAMSPKLNRVIKSSNGVFAIQYDDARTEGIVIACCPWCAKPLNTGALLD